MKRIENWLRRHVHRPLSLMAFFTLYSSFFTLNAQTVGEAFYIYRNDGQFNAFFRDEVQSIEYSNYDLDSLYYDTPVTQVIYTPDSIYRIPLAVVDSVGFVQPEEKYKQDVMRMSDSWLQYVVDITDYTITFSNGTPSDFLPSVGQVIVAETFEPPFDTGFSGRVTGIDYNSEGVVCTIETVGLTDIYEHLVTMGISASETEDSDIQKTRHKIWGVNYDQGVRFPLPNIDLAIGPATLTCVPDVVLKYIVCVGEPNMKNYVDIKVHHNYQGSVSLDCKLDADYKPEPNWMKYFIPITTGVPGLYGKIMFGSFVRATGSVQLSATQPFTINGVVGFEYSENKGFRRVNDWSASMQDTEISLNIEGSVSAGLAVRLQFGVIHERIASADVTAYLGPKLSGHLGLSSTGLIDKSLYSAIKDSEITLSLNAEIVPGYRWVGQKWVGEVSQPEEHQELPVSLDLGYPLNHWYVVPEFDNLGWQRDEEASSGTLSGSIRRNLLPKVSLGWGLYDENDNLCTSNYFSTTYRKIEDWPQNGLEYHLNNLPYGGKYKAYPLVQLFGVEMRADKSVDISADPLVKNVGTPEVTATKATVSGHVEGLNYGMVVDAGICYATNPNATQWSYTSAKTKEDGDFSVTISNLQPNATYYYCAYAYIDGEYFYADEILSFKTLFPVSTVSISDFKVTNSQYQDRGFTNDGLTYDYRFDVSVTASINDIQGVEDWGYVYRDPNGREKEISLMGYGTTYTDTRYAYFRNENPSTCTLYGYVKYVGSDETVYGEPHDYPLKHKGDTTCPDANHPHWIDLGLPSGTLWCCCNVGASSPEDYGGYYTFDEAQAFNPPSLDQIKEFLNNTTSVWTTQNGVNGRKFTSKINGGSVFLPFAGGRWGGEFGGVGTRGDFWSSTPSDEDLAYYLFFSSGLVTTGYVGARHGGRSVRPVR